MAKIDKEYNNLLEKIFQEGYTYEDPNRKDINRLEIPSYTFRHEFKDGFPAITTKKLHYKSVVTELLWFLKGDTNIKYLVDNGCNIWNKDAYNYYLKRNPNCTKEEFDKGIYEINHIAGDLGPVYGQQWRNIYCESGENDDIFKYDQIKYLINSLKNSPLGTQHIVNSWNVVDLDNMALQPCHYGFQVVVRPLNETYSLHILDIAKDTFGDNNKVWEGPKYGFELHWQQRSVDTFLGLPFNIASYATLALILEKITGYKALAIQGDLKKVHLYDNSIDAVKEQLSRDVDKYDKCELDLHPEFEICVNAFNQKILRIDEMFSEFRPDMFQLENYDSYPGIKIEMLERDE